MIRILFFYLCLLSVTSCYVTLYPLQNWFCIQFGDHDGIGTDVLLQHPLGIFCRKDGQIYIADSYNHKVLFIFQELSMLYLRITMIVQIDGNRE